MSQSKNRLVIVFTDGACRNNGKPNARASIGLFWGNNNPLNVSRRLELDGKATNNVAELTAILEALRLCAEHFQGHPVHLYTDSELCFNTFTKWASKWEARGWVKSDGGEIKNVGLIKDCWQLLRASTATITFFHCPSHKKAPLNKESKAYVIWHGNHMADTLANEALDRPLGG